MKLINLFTSPAIISICNIIILVYGLYGIKKLIKKFSKCPKNLTLFFKILFNNIKENIEVLLPGFIFLIIFILIGLYYANVRYLHAVCILLISSCINVLITFLIVKTIESLQKIKFENKFELTKNIYIETLNSIINSFGYIENGKSYNHTVPCSNINTPSIKDKFPNFKIHKNLNKLQELEYMKILTNEYNIELEHLSNWIIPSFKQQAITKKFYKSLNQLEFEINQIIQFKSIFDIDNIDKNYNELKIKYPILEESLLNHLEQALMEFWKYLYEENHNFYKYID